MTATAQWISEEERRAELEITPFVGRLATLGSFEPARFTDPALADVLRLCATELPLAGDGKSQWMLKESTRVNALAHFLEHGGMPAMSVFRRRIEPHFDTALQRVLDAWLLDNAWPVTEQPLDVAAQEKLEDDLSAYVHVHRWAIAAIHKARRPLSDFGGPGLDGAEGTLALLEITRPVRWLVRNPVIGRGDELNVLRAYRDAPSSGSGLSGDPALCLLGVGGIGKSTLVAAFVMEQVERKEHRFPWAYLDFDRSALRPDDPFTLVADIYRQVGAQYPDHRAIADDRRKVLARRTSSAGLESYDAGGSSREAALDLGRFLRSISARALIVLDTCEEMQRDPGSVDGVYQLFDALASAHGNLKLVVAGRGRVPEFESAARPDRIHHVRELAPAMAEEFLRARAKPMDLDADLTSQVVALVGGNPLSLSLAARVLVHDKVSVILDAVQRARAVGRVRDELVRGFLYQRILDHLQGRVEWRRDDLRGIARAALALRYVTPALIEEVLKPITGAHAVAGELYGDLAVEVAFVEDTGASLRLREDVRGPALAALRIEDAALVERVHAAAKLYFERNPNLPGARIGLLYHSLALSHAAVLYDATPDELGDLAAATIGLPDNVVDLIAAARADRRALVPLIVESELRTWERAVLERADSSLRSHDIATARRLLFERAERTPATELYRVESRLLEAEGAVHEASTAAHKDLEAACRAGHAERFAAAAVRLAVLLERLEHTDQALATLADAEESKLLSGATALRLELLLDRLIVGERTASLSEDERWLPTLEVRRRMRTLGSATNDREVLVRLVAAVLGRDEPEYLRRALQRVGLGATAAPDRIDGLAKALGVWSARTTKSLESIANIANATGWSNRISVLGRDAADLLLKLWDVEPPPLQVAERVRSFYLWWEVPFQQAVREGTHFLDTFPFDFDREEARAFEGLVIASASSVSELLYYAENAGISPSEVNANASPAFVVRDILKFAAAHGLMRRFVAELCKVGPRIASEVRHLAGDEWLATHHINVSGSGRVSHDDVLALHGQLVSYGFVHHEMIGLLLHGLPPAIVAAAPTDALPTTRLLRLLTWLNELPNGQGDHPFAQALRNVAETLPPTSGAQELQLLITRLNS